MLANRLAKLGGRRTPESVFERDYCLAWFLSALAQSDLHRKLAFKGGTALKRCYFADYRFSEDLDFTLVEAVTIQEILAELESVHEAVRTESGIEFRFDREDRHARGNSYTFYLRYVGPLPAGGSVKVDITIREQLQFPLEWRPVLRAYDEFADLPDGRVVQTYSLVEIAAEEVVALVDRARNEPRDLYDLWYLVSHGEVDLEALVPAIDAKLAFRSMRRTGLQAAIATKQARLRALWSARLARQMVALPPFEQVDRQLRRALRRSDLP